MLEGGSEMIGLVTPYFFLFAGEKLSRPNVLLFNFFYGQSFALTHLPEVQDK
jgi:hypothetical protein